MNTPTSSFDLNLDSDPELQSLTSELQRTLENSQSELAAEQQLALAEGTTQPPQPPVPPAPEPEPAQVGAWDTLGKVSGLPVDVETPTLASGKGPREITEELANVGSEELIENVTESALKSVARRVVKPPKVPRLEPLLWHYALEDKPSDPILENDLLQMLRKGELSWTTLVWRPALSNWTPAENTELKARAAAPPPLPAGESVTKAAGVGTIFCPKCGRATGVDDQFCSGCGTTLS